MLKVLLALWLSSSHGQRPWDTVDCLEINHHSQFTQIIAWDWSYGYERFNVRHWWMVTTGMPDRPRMIAGWWQYEYRGPDFSLRLRSRCFRETWTLHKDPEREDQALLPVRHRLPIRTKDEP